MMRSSELGVQNVDDDVVDEYAKLIKGMNRPRVLIDNDSCKNATIIWVDSVNEHGIKNLLDVVQFLTDLKLIIRKAYISSDGNWFMDVFNVTDHHGNKLTDKEILNYIQVSLESDSSNVPTSSRSSDCKEYTSVELIGTNRPGLFSEVSAVLKDLNCNVVKAKVLTRDPRIAAIFQLTDESSGHAIKEPSRLSLIKELLCNILKGDSNPRRAGVTVSAAGFTHIERRLHQMMLNDLDCEHEVEPAEEHKNEPRPQITVMDCAEKDYTVLTLRCKDRPKLLFDTLCTLADLHYVVFHGTVDAEMPEAYQEYYIRGVDGHRVNSEADENRLIQCLEAAIERRVEGLELELQTEDRVGLLSDVTRIFREFGLRIKRAEISTEGGKAVDIFHVSDMSGNPADPNTIHSVREKIGQAILRVKGDDAPMTPDEQSKVASTTKILIGSIFKGCSFPSFRLIRSYS